MCFVGIGSIAKRHIRNLRYIAKEKKFDIIIDAFRRNDLPVDGVNHVFCDFNALPNDYDAIFITNPTAQHLNTLKIFQEKGKNFFVEKPIVSLSQINEARELSLRKDSYYYVACPLRYNAVINYIKENVKVEDVISVRSISSSYLPDWRPNQDYRDSYSSHKDMGGGVSIDLIHEWDYLTYLFGFPQKVMSMIGKKSELEIDSDDYAIYIAEYEKMIVELHLDYFGRNTIREIQLFTKEDTIIGDLVSNSISFLKRQKRLDFNEERDDFQRREIQYFLNKIMNRQQQVKEYYHALSVLELTQGSVINERVGTDTK